MAWVVPNKLLLATMNGNAPDYDTATFGLLLLKTGYSPDLGDSGVDFVDDLTPGTNEVTGTNYARKTLASVTLGLSSAVVTFDAADVTEYAQSGAGFTDAARAVIYKDGANDAARQIIAVHAFPADVGNVAAALQLLFASDGILALTKS